MSVKINQKEYLKKYLSSDKNVKKKKKHKSKTKAQNIHIIDDDFDLANLTKVSAEDLEMYAIGEDAPQIVGVIDDRPPELIATEDYKKSIRWRTLATVETITDVQASTNVDENKKGFDFSPPRRHRHNSTDYSPKSDKKNRSPDLSNIKREIAKSKRIKPSRFKDVSPDTDLSLCRSKRHSPENSKQKYNSPDISPLRQKQRSPDFSPPRRHRKKSPDISPPPRRKKGSPDISPPRRQDRNTDIPPPRKRRISVDISPPRQKNRSPNKSPQRFEKNSDLSPPRQRKRSPDIVSSRYRSLNSSPNQRKGSSNRMKNDFDRDSSSQKTYKKMSEQSKNQRKSVDYSPPRKQNESISDFSPPRRRKKSASPSKNLHLSPKRERKYSDSSPPRRKTNYNNSSMDRSPEHKLTGKMSKTLDGKAAGLQDAKALRQETNKFRKREETLFNTMSAEASGRNADVVVRDRKTGKIRDLQMEAEKDREKIQKEQERKAVYDRWGKGLKQVEDYRARMDDNIHEANKPLARYSDDKDLDELLKKQERDGDPMLQYIRNKDDAKNSSKPSKPIYNGSYPENRFGIRPGYRWDGVDRSNGYEVKWFEVQSHKKAGEEEAYKYSTEDM